MSNPNGTRPIMLAVLGVHRSGTSMATRMMECLGAAPSVRLVGAGRSNPRGFFEDVDVMRFNGRVLLRALGAEWNHAAPIEWGRLAPAAMEELLGEAVSIVLRNYSLAEPLSVVKDPRMCALLPFWIDALGRAGFELRVVAVVRDPLSVARSLLARNGIPLAHGSMMYGCHWTSALSSFSTVSASCVSYDAMLEDPSGELRRVARELSLDMPRDFESMVRSARECFVDTSLRHSSAVLEEVAEDPSISTLAVEVFETLLLGSRGHGLQSAQMKARISSSVARLESLAASLAGIDRSWARSASARPAVQVIPPVVGSGGAASFDATPARGPRGRVSRLSGVANGQQRGGWRRVRRPVDPTPLNTGMHAESRFSLSSWIGFELMRRKLRAVSRPDMFVLNTRMSWSDLWTPTLAHYCDWSITDFGFHGNRSRQPRTVFVTPRFPYLAHFFDRVLPMIDRGTRFVLVTGAADLTVPRQRDCRGASFEGTAMRAHFDALLRDQRLLRWHADNVDAASAGIRPIPCGSAGRYGGCPSARIDRFVTPVSLGGRLIRALCMHHVRRGDQWERRRTVTMLAQTQWADAVDTLPAVPEREFFSTLRRYAFTICATGGGVDPSPKAWAAMLAGSIPIIERGPMESAYQDLPIAWVEEWSEDSISPQRLDDWLSSLRRHYEDPELRRLMVHRLSMGYWWRKLSDGSTSMWPAPVGASG